MTQKEVTITFNSNSITIETGSNTINSNQSKVNIIDQNGDKIIELNGNGDITLTQGQLGPIGISKRRNGEVYLEVNTDSSKTTF